MSILFAGYKSSPQRVTIAPGAAIAVEARPGTELRGLEGTVWVTQEGDAQDYVVPAGVRFTAGRVSRLVATAMRAQARVAVGWHAPSRTGATSTSRVSVD